MARSSPHRFDVAIVGSGFAGSTLARVLAAAGRSVLLVERGHHPRFALGESSTPLAAIALERLAERLGHLGADGADLHALATAGRWRRQLDPPQGEHHLGRGLKRGFSFYRHRPGRPYTNSPDNDARLLVAASPDDELADNHWLRADVDHHLARRAVAAGAVLWEGWELTGVETLAIEGTRGGAERGSGEQRVRLAGRPAGIGEGAEVETDSAPGDDAQRLGGAAPWSPATVDAAFIVDASGPGGFLARHLEIPTADPGTPETSLLFGHFAGAVPFADAARSGGVELAPGPYPDDRAAVHHVLDEGWMYVLRFDPIPGREGEDSLASAGIVLRAEAAKSLARLAPEAAFHTVLQRYPTLAASFADARPVRPVARIDGIAHRLAHTHGDRWLLLPHAYAFFDPLFSTGLAWSLLGVERAVDLLSRGALPPPVPALERYGELLTAEADHLSRLVAGAWAAMPDFALLAAQAQLYFAAASFTESQQRLTASTTAGGHPWAGFLGARDSILANAVAEAQRRLAVVRAAAPAEHPDEQTIASFESWVAAAIAARNVAGLADPARRNLYPVDLQALIRCAPLLGLTPADVSAALPGLGLAAPPA